MKLALVLLVTSLAVFAKGQIKQQPANLETRAVCTTCNFKGIPFVASGSWVAQIFVKGQLTFPNNNTNFNFTRFCAGSIVGARFILTAASCLRDAIKNQTKIYVGSKIYNNYTQVVYPLHWFTPNAYAETIVIDYKKINDLAVIITAETIELNENTKIVELLNVNCKVTENVNIASWDLKQKKKQLLKASTDAFMQNRKLCIDQFGPHKISRSVICGKPSELKYSCPGNDGAPMYYSNNGTTWLYGIYSMGISNNCSTANFGLYTAISEYLPWIRIIMSLNI